MSGRDWRKAETRKRSRLVGVRLTPVEHIALMELAHVYHMTVPAFIRAAVFGVSDRITVTPEGENEGGAARVPALTAPDRTPLGKQEAG